MLIYAAANQGRSSTSFIGSLRNRMKLVPNVLAVKHLCTYAHQTELPEFVLPK